MMYNFDPGPVELHARNVEFDWKDTPLHWIPNHPVPSNVATMLNLLLPEGERWFVQTYNEALPLVKDEELASAMRGFIGQEAMHAETHDRVLWEFLETRGLDPRPFQQQMEWVFRKVLGPSRHPDPEVRQRHLVERLWFIAAIEHYTAILGDFALNNTWTEYNADPAMADLFRWHGAEEVEHREVAHDVATYFGDSYLKRGRAMLVVLPAMLFVINRGTRFLALNDPGGKIGYTRLMLGYFRGAHKGLLPTVRSIILATFTYFKPSFRPTQVGCTAQAVAYLASSPAARAANK
jgi:hypothetical protein